MLGHINNCRCERTHMLFVNYIETVSVYTLLCGRHDGQSLQHIEPESYAGTGSDTEKSR